MFEGSATPKRISCTIDVNLDSRPCSIIFTFPLPLVASPICKCIVSPDVLAPRGIRVQLKADVPASLQWEIVEKDAEEFVRRGGGVRVVPWVWRRVKAAQ